ncbi:hypothetical protein CHS0354_017587, partial [Potamilus streckersoni]
MNLAFKPEENVRSESHPVGTQGSQQKSASTKTYGYQTERWEEELERQRQEWESQRPQ